MFSCRNQIPSDLELLGQKRIFPQEVDISTLINTQPTSSTADSTTGSFDAHDILDEWVICMHMETCYCTNMASCCKYFVFNYKHSIIKILPFNHIAVSCSLKIIKILTVYQHILLYVDLALHDQLILQHWDRSSPCQPQFLSHSLLRQPVQPAAVSPL